MTDQKAYNQKLIEDFRASRSLPGGPMEGRSLLLLTTTGAKSGNKHITPLMFIADGERLLLMASNAGAPDDPQWYRNLVAHPQVTVEVGSDTFETIAVVAQAPLRQQLWEKIVSLHAFFADHQAKITRQIPVVMIEKKRTP